MTVQNFQITEALDYTKNILTSFMILISEYSETRIQRNITSIELSL